MRGFKFPKQQHADTASLAFVTVLAHSRAPTLCLGQLTHQLCGLHPCWEQSLQIPRDCRPRGCGCWSWGHGSWLGWVDLVSLSSCCAARPFLQARLHTQANTKLGRSTTGGTKQVYNSSYENLLFPTPAYASCFWGTPAVICYASTWVFSHR